MAIKIFISYRREDSTCYAGWLHDRLEGKFGRNSLFFDLYAMPIGAEFIEIMRKKISQSDVLLVVIGANWLDTSRLEKIEDPVRLEIVTAFENNLLVVPVLVGGAMIPNREALPDGLRAL
jgi:hypothetical protein